MSKIKVVIGIPTAGYTQPEALHSIWYQAFHLGKLQAENPRFEFFFCPRGRMYVAMNREVIMEKAIEMGADYVFMVDDDMLFKADIFETLLKHDVDLCAALAFTRNHPHLPVMYQSSEGYDPIEHRDYYRLDWIRNYPKNKLVEVDAVGFGCVLINTKIVRKMERPYFMSSTGTGEDITFCVNFKKAGGRIFTDTSCVIGHLGNPPLIDDESYDKTNDPKQREKLYGPYEKYGVRDVCYPDKVDDAEKKEVVLGK